jgi:hypothetical protein
MKTFVAVALIATSFPVLATSASARDGDSASRERRVCTQVSSARAGSRMSARRICRTPTEWREALGPDWRLHLAGSTGLQDDYDALRQRAAPEDLNPGIQPEAGGLGVAQARAGGPR